MLITVLKFIFFYGEKLLAQSADLKLEHYPRSAD
jgi:hypothetical protein